MSLIISFNTDSNLTYGNTCVQIQDHIFDYVDLKSIQIIFGLAYTLLFLSGVAANCATLRCLICLGGGVTGSGGSGPGSGSGKRKMKFGVSREFLISLSLADLFFIACTSLPLTAVHIFTRRWLLGGVACRFGPLLQGVGCFVTSFSLTAIAIERYAMITRVNAKRTNQRANIWVVLCIWILAIACASPLSSAYHLRRECTMDVGCFCGEFCDEIAWTSEWSRTVYGSVAFALQYVLPACVLAFCYYKVCERVNLSVQKRLKKEHISLLNQQRLSRRKTRASRMTLFLFAGFVCPWLPMSIMNLLRDFNHLPQDWYAVVFAASHFIAMTSILCNPIVYCWANRNFRSAFTSALFCRDIVFTNQSTMDDDCECDYGTAATEPVNSSRTYASVLERSFRSGRSNSHSSGRRSRLDTGVSSRSRLNTGDSLGCRSGYSNPRLDEGASGYSRPRPSSWQHDGTTVHTNSTVLRAKNRTKSLLANDDTSNSSDHIIF